MLIFHDTLNDNVNTTRWHALCIWIPCIMYLDPMHYVFESHGLCIWIPCIMYLDPMHYVFGSHALCIWIPCIMYLDPMQYVFGSHALCIWIPCNMYLDPMHYVFGSHALCFWIPWIKLSIFSITMIPSTTCCDKVKQQHFVSFSEMIFLKTILG